MLPLDSFFDELEKLGGLTDLVKRTSGWMKGQYNQLGAAAGQALQGPQSTSPITGQMSPPMLGTLKHFVANKIPAPTKPPGPIASGVQRVLSSRPAKAVLPLADQASEFLKLAGRAHELPKTEKCSHCSKPATKRVFWCEHRVYQPTCEDHLSKTVAHLKTQNYDEIDGIEKVAKVSAYQQKTQYSCSAACLKSVLEHWGADRFAEHEIMYAIKVKDKGGAEVDQITGAAKELGFDAYDKSFKSLDEAQEITDQDIPIIADIQSFNHRGSGHYVVITKIDDNTVHLMDPNTDGNQRIITRAEMEKRWWDRTMAPPHKLMSKWGIVVTPRKK